MYFVLLASLLFTFWFCTYRTLQKPHRPPHLGAAMESEYFLLSTPIWEQVFPKWVGNVWGAFKGKGKAMMQYFGSCRCVSNIQQATELILNVNGHYICLWPVGMRSFQCTELVTYVSNPRWMGRKSCYRPSSLFLVSLKAAMVPLWWIL